MLMMVIGVLQMILLSTLALQDTLFSSRVMIMKLLFLLHSKSQTMPMLGMILRLGVVVHPGSKLHLGQKPKLGGRYTDIIHLFPRSIWSVLCISMLHFLLLFF